MIFRVALTFMAVFAFLSASFAQNAAELDTVAQVDGQRISLQDLEQVSGEPLARLEGQAYQLKQQKLDQIIDYRLLAGEAHRRGISLDALVEAEITSKVAEVSPQEIHMVYELNKNQLQKSESEMQDQIRKLLRDQKLAVRHHEFAKTLRAKAKVTVYLDPPPPFRTEVSGEGPSRGSAGAPVTIVEFEDFQCPFCKRAQATLDEILARYKDKVRVVHRDFPLEPLHPASMRAHEAARCADDQGKFWEYRELLYKNSPSAAPEQLNDYAAKVGADVRAFQQCVESGKFKDAIQKDEAEGERLGIQGTPAFFINGRPLSGAQPENEFAQIIDEELNRGTAVASKSPK